MTRLRSSSNGPRLFLVVSSLPHRVWCSSDGGHTLATFLPPCPSCISKLDVDHMVPLGNAHDSGAWRWSAQQEDAEASSVY